MSAPAIRAVDKAEDDACERLIETIWEARGLHFPGGWYTWRFRDNPFPGSVQYAAWSGGDLRAHVGYCANRIAVPPATVVGVEAVDLVSHPAARGQGLGTAVIAHVDGEASERGITLGYSFPVDGVAQHFYRAGWRAATRLGWWHRPLARAARTILGGRAVAEPPAEPAETVRTALAARRTALTKFHEILVPHHHGAIALERGMARLAWRYAGNPFHTYGFVAVDDGAGGLLGYAVTRVRPRGRFVEGIILDVVAGRGAGRVLRRAVKQFAAQGADVASFFGRPTPRLSRALLGSGFLPAPKKPIVFIVRAFDGGIAERIADGRGWYLTAGDVDSL